MTVVLWSGFVLFLKLCFEIRQRLPSEWFHEQTRLSGRKKSRLSSGTDAGTLTWMHDRFQIVEGMDLCLVMWYSVKCELTR